MPIFVSAEGPIRSFLQLETMVKKNRVKTVEQLLPLLDEDLRSNFSLIPKTRSSQGASFALPRVNLFARDADFILAYAGSPDVEGGHTIETLQLTEGSQEFEFGQIDFSESKPKFLRPNQVTTCFVCHTGRPGSTRLARLEAHPIWDSYPEWPDRYGAAHLKYMGVGASKAMPSAKLESEWAEFILTSAETARYQPLIGLKEMSQYDLGVMNSDFGNLILGALLKRTANQITANRLYSRYATALDFTFVGQRERRDKYLPEPERKEYLKERARLKALVRNGQKRYFEEKVQRYSKLTERNAVYATQPLTFAEQQRIGSDVPILLNFEKSRFEYLELLLFILEKMGLPREIMNLTFERDSFSFTQGALTIEDLGFALRDARERCSSKLKKISKTNSSK